MGQGQLAQPLSAVPKPNLLEFGLWVFRRRFRLRVVGLSMVPTLYPGDEVLVDDQAYIFDIPAVGDLVVAEHPGQPELRIVKRVVAISSRPFLLPQDHRSETLATQTFTVQGDNQEASTDSRSFGNIPAHKIAGKVTSLFYRAPQ